MSERPCEALFERLAATDPSRLLAMLPDLEPPDMTFAAEVAGRIGDSDAVRRAVLPLLEHPMPYVREGAIYGLSSHMDETTRSLIARLAVDDPSPGVRLAAEGAIEVDAL